MKSIQFRLTVWLLATILPLLVVSGVLLYLYTARSFDREFNGNLKNKLQTFARMAEWEDGEDDEDEIYIDHGDDAENLLRFEFAELLLPEFEPSRSAEYYQVTDPQGRVYARSASLSGRDLGSIEQLVGAESIVDTDLPDGRRGRMATLAFTPGVDDEGEIPADAPPVFLLTIARSTEDLAGILAIVRNSMLLGGGLTIAAIALIIWRVTRRGLRPLIQLSEELSQTDPSDPARPLAGEDCPAELAPVYARLNELLERVNAAMGRERRFTSDVAHELRTPIAELRTLAEVCAARPNLGETERASFEDTLKIALSMDRLVSTLLELARWSSGELGTDLRRADLARLIDSAWQPLKESAEEKGLDVHVSLERTIEIKTDPLILGMIFSNLLSNAVSYTPEGGTISLECDNQPDGVALTISNTTDNLLPRDIPNLFEKFWRKDRARAGDAHFGLGLPLVAALARVVGVRIESRMPQQGVFEVCLVHPR